MASPAYIDTEAYTSGTWPSDRTLSNPAWSSSARVFVATHMHYVHTVDGSPPPPNFDHWGGVPGSWSYVGSSGIGLQGISNVSYSNMHVWTCRPAEVSATIRPEKADGTLFTPAVRSEWWRAWVVGYTPSKLPNAVTTGGSGELDSTVARAMMGGTTGVGEGTLVQFSSVIRATFTGTTAANGYTIDYTGGSSTFRVSSQQFSSGLTSSPARYTKSSTGSFNIGGALVVALDIRDPAVDRQRIGLGWMVA